MNALTVNGKQLTIDSVEILGYDNSVPYTLLYENDNTYTGAAGIKFATGALTSDSNFIVITFKLSTGTTNFTSYTHLRTSIDKSKNIFVGNYANSGAYAYASYFRSGVSGRDALMNPIVGTDGANTGNVYYTSTVNADDANDYKIIFDKSTAKAYCYVNKLNILNADYISFNPLNFEAGIYGNNVTFGSVKVLACETLADALDI